jgi:hypothetical protein
VVFPQAIAVRDAASAALGGAPAWGRRLASPPPADLESLRASLAAGVSALGSLDAATARAAFEAVTAALEADAELASAAPDLLDAPLYLGVVALGLGQGAAADAAFQRAVRLAPDRAPRPGRFAPAVEKAYALARVRLEAVRPAVVRVRSEPADGDLFVDGIYRGRAPVGLEPADKARTLLLQAPGIGIVTQRVEGGRYGPDLVAVTIPAGVPAPALVGLAETLATAEPPLPLSPPLARALAEELGADRLALVWLEADGDGLVATAGLLDLDTGAWVAVGPAGRGPDPHAVGRALGAWLVSPPATRAARAVPELPDWRTAAAPASSPQPATGINPVTLPHPAGLDTAADPKAPERPWYRRWYWWAVAGAVAAGVAVGAASSGGGGGGGQKTGGVVVGP